MKVLVSALFVMAFAIASLAQACPYSDKMTKLTTDQQKVTDGSSPMPVDTTKQPLIVTTQEEKTEVAN